MYRIKIEQFEVMTEQTGYIKEVGKLDIYEQVVDHIDLQEVILAVNSRKMPTTLV